MAEHRDRGNGMERRLGELRIRLQREKEHVQMYDWQCQRTTRMLRDVAEDRFHTMVQVQQIAVREAHRLRDTEASEQAHRLRRRNLQKYTSILMGFRGPLRQSEGVLRALEEDARVAALLGRVVNLISPKSKKSLYMQGGKKLADAKLASAAIAPSRDADDDADSFSDLAELHTHSHAPIGAPSSKDGWNTSMSTKTRTLTQIAVDREIASAHENSAQNRALREESLRVVAEQQARSLATQDLRLRIFDQYWSSLPSSMERVRRKSMKPADVKGLQEAWTGREFLNRTEEMWRSAGAQFWRSKEAYIRAALKRNREWGLPELEGGYHMGGFRERDPLDENLNPGHG
ncbi:hypothetical protein B484DRAFT_414159, partial [Ochromonadaceae sp. CCMP2298]